MAFVSDKYKLIFIHIPKNAGTTISEALCKIHGTQLVGIDKGIYQHEGVGLGVPTKFRPNRIDVHDTYKDIINKYPKAKDYHAFAVISNPWERIFSFWKHKKRRGDEDLDHSLSFSDALRKSNVLLLQPQLWWFSENPSIWFLRKERLEQDFWYWCHLMRLEKPQLTKLNTDIEKDNYKNHYDEYGIDLIKEFYRAEIERFGYEF